MVAVGGGWGDTGWPGDHPTNGTVLPTPTLLRVLVMRRVLFRTANYCTVINPPSSPQYHDFLSSLMTTGREEGAQR